MPAHDRLALRSLPLRRPALLAVSAVLLAAADAHAATAPAQLRGKSILLNWGESGTYKRLSDGKENASTGKISRTIYVSQPGRAFVRASSVSGPYANSSEAGPEKTAESVSFNGNTMIAIGVNTGVARRISVTFDPAFSSCTGAVTIGKSGPGTRIKGFDGAMYEVLSMQPGSVSCAIRDGNSLAN